MQDDSTPHARQPLALIYSAMALSRLHHPVEPGDKKLRKSPAVSGYAHALPHAEEIELAVTDIGTGSAISELPVPS